MIKKGDWITLDNDKWYDAGKRYRILDFTLREGSTAVELHLEDEDDNMFHRTESSNVIIVEKTND